MRIGGDAPGGGPILSVGISAIFNPDSPDDTVFCGAMVLIIV
jgi:hypothetical protein